MVAERPWAPPARNAAAAICQDVLEHLTDPDRALYTIVRALKPGGELILACSNPASPKGIVSKLTPHWFHRFVYKRGWFGYTFVDDPAYPPFKTYMRWSIQPSALRRTLSELGFTTSTFSYTTFAASAGWAGSRRSGCERVRHEPGRGLERDPARAGP